jgi:hypothetical protein
VRAELESTRGLLEKQQSKVHALTELVARQKESLGEVREESESKDICIAQLQTRMREMETQRQDAVLQLQQTLMLHHAANEDLNDPSKRGNSLFSEVDQRRVKG